MADSSAPLDAELLREAFAVSPLPMAVLDEAGAVVYANEALAAVAGDDMVAIAGRELLGDEADEGTAALVAQLRSGRLPVARVHGRLAAADGSTEEVAIGIRPLPDGHLLAYVEDVSWRVGGVGGTGVPGLVGPRVLDDLLRLVVTDEEPEAGIAVLSIRIDDLAPRVGSGIAEHLVAQVGRRLVELLRSGDTASRYDGNEYVVVGMADDHRSARSMRDRLAGALRTPYDLADRHLELAIGIGLAYVDPQDTPRPEPRELISAARADRSPAG